MNDIARIDEGDDNNGRDDHDDLDDIEADNDNDTLGAEAEDSPALVADLALVDRFCDALWLEDGLARNTIDAYRRDLALLSRR